MSPHVDMNGKVCIVTGATSGIGEVSARELARMGARVVLVCRSPEKARATTERIRNATGRDVELVLADLSSQEQIRRAAKELLERCPRIDVLLNNAGITNLRREVTVDGLEAVFAVNHLGYFLLTNLLLDRICETPDARIVNVASEAHRFGSIDFDDLGCEHKKFRWMRVYGQSKLANVLFTRELAKRLQDRGVTVNALHPGAVATGLGTNNGGLITSLVVPLLRPFFRTPERGAETSIHLCTSPDVAGVSGRYFSDCKEKSLSREAQDDGVAQRLWGVSEQMTAPGAGSR